MPGVPGTVNYFARMSKKREMPCKARIAKRVHAQGIRNTCAAELAVEGTPVPLIQKQLGHASLHTTTVYLRSIAPVELDATMCRRTWTPEGS